MVCLEGFMDVIRRALNMMLHEKTGFTISAELKASILRCYPFENALET